MIIPTTDYDPMFAADGVPFRDKMIAYIIREFSDTLGPQTGLLHSDAGLDALSAIYNPSAADTRRQSRAA